MLTLRPENAGDLRHASPSFVSIPVRIAEVERGARETIEQYVARGGSREISLQSIGGSQEELRLHTKRSGGERCGPAMIGLDTPAGEHVRGFVGNSLGEEVLQLANLVTRQMTACEVVAFDEELATEGLRQGLESMQRGWQVSQREAVRQVHVGMVPEPRRSGPRFKGLARMRRYLHHASTRINGVA